MTETATTTTTISIDIAARAKRVFRALTSNVELEAWFAEHADVDLCGGALRLLGTADAGQPGREEGRHQLLGWEAGRSVAFAWAPRGTPATVRVLLDETDGVTCVTVEPAPGGVRFLGFWCLALQNLRSYVEEGVVAWRPDFGLQFGSEVRLEISAAAGPGVVYRALMEPDQLSRWMMADDAIVEATVGGRYDLGWPEQSGRPLAILELEPDKRLTYSWADPAIDGTVVTWELEGSDGATRITLVHSGFGDQAASQGEYYGGWADFLVRLKWMVEKGAGWVGPAMGRGVTAELAQPSKGCRAATFSRAWAGLRGRGR